MPPAQVPTASRYTYGDSPLAARRLRLLAKVLGPTSRTFYASFAGSDVRLALDLGCGPGRTTRLLHEAIGSAETVGIDRSPAFLRTARRGSPPGVRFVRGDVTRTPFPTGEPDLVSCRLLLAHLPDPEDVITRWTAATAPGGVLLLEEPVGIETEEPAFLAYLSLAESVVARAGATLFVGDRLGTMSPPAGTVRVHDDVIALSPSVPDAAAIFGMNLAVLVERGEIPAQPGLTVGLRDAGIAPSAAPSRWRIRQLAFRRTDG
jgi:SAM-dependent methyltransferase